MLHLGWILALGKTAATSVRNLLKHHVSLRSSPAKSMLEFLSNHCTNKSDASQLKRLAKNDKAHDLWKLDNPGLIDVFRTFPSIRVDSSALLYRMKTIEPR